MVNKPCFNQAYITDQMELLTKINWADSVKGNTHRSWADKPFDGQIRRGLDFKFTRHLFPIWLQVKLSWGFRDQLLSNYIADDALSMYWICHVRKAVLLLYVTWSRGMSRMSEMLFLRYWQNQCSNSFVSYCF